MRNGLAVKDHANKLGRAPPHPPPLRGIGVPAFTAIHHIALHLVGDVGGNLRSDGAGTTDGGAVVNQSCCLFAFLRGDQI